MSQDFYEGMAPYYHLIYRDWDEVMDKQAASLDGVIRKQWGDEFINVLDVACGIGTQAIGLSMRGYNVTASDLSPASVERAALEARERGLNVNFSVADMQAAAAHHGTGHDIVICCDDSVLNLTSDEAILATFRGFYESVRPGGACLVSVRDHDKLRIGGSRTSNLGVKTENGVSYRLFRVQDVDGETCDTSIQVIVDDGRGAETIKIFRTSYRAISPDRLLSLMSEAGFSGARRIDGQYFQPLIVGTRDN